MINVQDNRPIIMLAFCDSGENGLMFNNIF